MNAAEMPPVANRPLYLYRILMKWFSFFIFGLGTLTLALLVFPVMLVFLHPKENFQKLARRLISVSFRGFIIMMGVLGVVELDVEDRGAFRGLSSKIVVANHPSLLDVVMMVSLIPNADVIVRGNLVENIIVRGVVRRLYILSSLDFDRIVEDCRTSLDRGNCMVIFPEGTRTPRSGEVRLKKGAARLSLLSGRDIIPVHIGGTDKYGLGKNDPFAAFNHTEKYIYRVRIQGKISPGKYAGMEMPRAVRRINDEIRELLFNPVNP
ncbi:MAG: 1-acyl-sn-glycerol-3-phosphate acyltransferase [Treponema sp.]|jgi:1-acyl-sn-glycerol-3-phosphate acyltransferase|nr:1-acyl-sn-glycerol-3-phosphate acyltransferase [Treponema sp.]